MKQIAFVILMVMSLSVHAGSNWELKGTSGKMKFILVDKNHVKNKEIYKSAIRELCNKQSYCKLMFWSEQKYVPEYMPLNDAQVKNKVADFVYNNNTGYKKFLMSCKYEKNKEKCFSEN